MSTTADKPTPTGEAVSAEDAATEIGELRVRIDAVDDEIIRLIQERRALSNQVGRLRASVGGPRLSIGREHQIMGKFANEIGTYGSQVALLLLKISRGRM
ncbi:chorismate mutase [Cumulibacter soli]|uniref:chorismate mutase n=1 Tax=Cumulibacter soli TaxID=2546344 RepID=UPI0014194F3E|nr:chorismate mutase [Cumulibacter soli]